MNCIFICIFNNENYIKLFYLLLESIYIYGNLDENTKLVVYTSTPFMEIIKQSHLYNNNIIFEINDTYNTIDTACKARLDLFQLPSITKFDKILYLDTDIIIKNDVNSLFSIIEEDVLYVLEEGTIDHPMDCWGKTLFGDEINDYDDKTAFTSGILLFNNCEKNRDLFNIIKNDIIDRPYHFECYDQPYFVYNSFKYNLCNKVLLKSFAINNNTDINSDKTIHHFPGGPGVYEKKLDIMQQFLTNLKDLTIINNIQKTKEYINEHLFPIINNCNELVEGNIFMLHHTNDYSDVFLNKSKNISNLVLNKNITNVMEIGFNAGFSTLLMLLSNPKLKITCFDLGEHSYTLPCYEKIKEIVGEDRIKIIIGDSTKTLKEINETYQLIHIDGGHSTDVADSDIIESIRLSANNTILIMDDYDFPNLHELWDRYINNYKLQPLDIFIYNSPHHDIKYIKKSNIPKIFMQTSKEKPNNDIIQQIRKQCPDWKYIHYNDNDILDFFMNNPIDELPNIIDKFNAISSGAHKADLFRYYFLYLKGGLFMDSDAMIYENIETIIKDYDFISVQSNGHIDCIFQGILGCTPKNKIIKEALWKAYNTDPQLLQSDYHYWCKQLYTILKEDTFDYNIKLYEERRINDVDDILDDETLLFKHYWKHKVIPKNEYLICFDTKYGKIFLNKNDKYFVDIFSKNEYWDDNQLCLLKDKYIPNDKNILEIGGHSGTSTIFY